MKKKGIGLFACVAMIAGGMIGSAIFSLSGLTMYKAGPAAVLSWVIAAVIMLIYGLVCAELSGFFPRSGGVYVFPSRALGGKMRRGAFWGWVSTWGYINANIVAVAFAAIYVATYLGAGFSMPDGLQIPLALFAIALCLVLNIVRFSTAGKLNNILVALLLTCMLTFVGVSLFGGEYDASMLLPFFSQGSVPHTGFLAAVPTAMVGYGSVVAVAFMVSEVRDPKKNVPRAIVIAMGIVTAVYVLMILATLGLVSARYLEENPGMRYIPIYAACFTKLMGAFPWIAKVVSVAAVLALLTTILVVLALTGRALQAAAQDGLMPGALARNGRFGTPVAATAVIAAAAAILSCFPGATEIIVGFGALFAVVTITINIVSLYVARKTQPIAPDAFRAPGGQVLPAIALLLIVVCYIPDILSGGLMIWVFTALWYGLGLLIYRFSKAGRAKK